MASYTNKYYVFTTGKELRDIGNCRVLDAYMKSRTLTNQNYVPRRKKIVKPANKWRAPVPKIEKHEQFFFNVSTTNHFPTQNTKCTFIFRGMTQAVSKKKNFKPSKPTNDGKLISKQNRKKYSKPKMIDSYAIREQEPKAEVEERAQRRAANWRRRTLQKLGKIIKTLTINKDKLKKIPRMLTKIKNRSRQGDKSTQTQRRQPA